jgi:phosphoglucosamine mutase
MEQEAVREAIDREGIALSGRGRVLVRPSGTEPLIRVMVEAPSESETDAACARLREVVETAMAASARDATRARGEGRIPSSRRSRR